jgi:hypothetical protein
MKQALESQEERALQRRGWRLLALATGAALAVAWVALSAPGPLQAGSEHRWIVDDTPPAVLPQTHRVAALDAGVDWERVERAPDPAPMAVAAYER